MGLQVFGAQAHAFGTVETHGADVARFELVVAHHVFGGLVERRLVVRHFHAEDVGRTEQPIGVLAQAEDRGAAVGLVRAHAFEYPHPVMQSVGQHVHLGFTPGHQLAV